MRAIGKGKIGNVPLPAYASTQFLTKTPPAMSEEQYKKAIIAQAKKDYAAGKIAGESPECMQLLKSFQQVVSPDRKSVIEKGLHQIFSGNAPLRNEPQAYSLLDYLFGSVKYQKENFAVASADFYDSNGELIASFTNSGWHTIETETELARGKEFYAIYNGTITNEMINSATKTGKKADELFNSSI